MVENEVPEVHCWPLWVRLEKRLVESRGWHSENWRVAEIATRAAGACDAYRLCLELYRDERIAYRFNLSSQAPTLFVLCEQLDQALVPRRLSVCQDVAAAALDGNEPVLSVPMPQPIVAWLERFMAVHGEAPDPDAHRRRARGKKRGAAEPQADCRG